MKTIHTNGKYGLKQQITVVNMYYLEPENSTSNLCPYYERKIAISECTVLW